MAAPGERTRLRGTIARGKEGEWWSPGCGWWAPDLNSSGGVETWRGWSIPPTDCYLFDFWSDQLTDTSATPTPQTQQPSQGLLKTQVSFSRGKYWEHQPQEGGIKAVGAGRASLSLSHTHTHTHTRTHTRTHTHTHTPQLPTFKKTLEWDFVSFPRIFVFLWVFHKLVITPLQVLERVSPGWIILLRLRLATQLHRRTRFGL